MASGEFRMTILGRTIEHLGTQMYKHRAPSLAELVANAWDAGAKEVRIDLSAEGQYNPATSEVGIMDSGEGMDPETVQHCYLVVGRNRRTVDGAVRRGRKIMGRKGIGKLAGFGLAERITVTTWTAEMKKAIRFSMTLDLLKGDAGTAHDIRFPWQEVERGALWPPSGTRISLSQLRHASPIGIDSLRETLARRFSRTTRGEMTVFVDDVEVKEPVIDSMYRFPEDGAFREEKLPTGQIVRYRYAFARKPIHSKELQGFVIYTSERTAQAPPFFFNVESTASSQHSTRYVTGEVIADYLDAGTDNESDVVSTDRQELDWEKDELATFRKWGEELARRVLRECAERRGRAFENWVLEDEDFRRRLGLLDQVSQKEVSRFLKTLGQKSDENDERTRGLADSLIRAYEFRNFHDVVGEIHGTGDDPERLGELLGKLRDWKVLESRAILEIVRGRLKIIQKFEKMIIENAPETASVKTSDNLHDLLAEYPWIFNPEWQVFADEKSVGRQLREWGMNDCPEDMKLKRVDFLAFARSDGELVIIELKRPRHAMEFDEIQRLEQYQVRLMAAHPNCRRVVIYGGSVNIPENKWKEIQGASDFEAVEWSSMFNRVKRFYSHYEDVLEGHLTPEFRSKEIEVLRTREILDGGTSHRSNADRNRGLGDAGA